MKIKKLWILLTLAAFLGMGTGVEASMKVSGDDELIYESSYTSARQTIGEGNSLTHTFNSVPTEGFANLQGQLTLSLSAQSGKGKNAPVINVYAGDPDKDAGEWFQLADNYTVKHKKVTFELSNEILESILSDANGNIAFGIDSLKGDVLLKSARLEISGTAVPIPGALWLLGSGLLGLVGFRRALHS